MAGELILVIEDDDNSRKLLRDALRVTGYETAESATAEQGLRMAADLHPALILMDIQLPGMNGIEALGHLRENPLTCPIPVIAVTASLMSTQQDVLSSAGFDAMESKPISVMALLRRMRLLLDRHAPAPT